ncbi:MAG TPA: methyltransferase domain-containing protein [Terriglobia bacterium]|nr:methyltransferase domain-containing protein [Terriglobia bacterium]
MEPDVEKNACCHTRLAPEYDACMAKHAGNAWVRGAFRHVVEQIVAPGSLLLDFGCGTGTDSLWYAQRGYRVLAYDNAPGMMAELERKCAQEIALGKVVPLYADYDHFRQVLQREPRPQAIVSNFAALNHLRELRPLFSVFAANLEPPGQVIANVLNPLFWQDLIHPWWWRPLLRGIQTGYISCVWEEVSTYRHFMGPISRAARPHFVKVGQAGLGTFLRYESGSYDWTEPRSLPERLDARFCRSFPLRHLGKFIFLIFRRAERDL